MTLSFPAHGSPDRYGGAGDHVDMIEVNEIPPGMVIVGGENGPLVSYVGELTVPKVDGGDPDSVYDDEDNE